jgi:RNA polymerase sigma-70 factor (sigma-E family)
VEQSLPGRKTIGVRSRSPELGARNSTERDDVFAAAMVEHGDRLARMAFFLCGDRSRAEDLVSEAFAATWPKWSAGRVDNLPAYLRRAVVNRASKDRRHWMVVVRHDREAPPPSPFPGADEGLSLRIDLTRSLATLPPPQRVVLVLRYLEDMTEAEIALLLGVPLGTVKSRLARALDGLRHQMTGGDHG